MTWLPVETSSLAERDAVLSLKPEFYDGLCGLLRIGWRMSDAALLDLCRLRLAQMMRTRAELAGADEDLLLELDDWRSSPAFRPRDRAALDYAEQYHVDQTGISDEQKHALSRHLSEGEVFNFVHALWVNDSYMRVLSLLDIEADPPSQPFRPERTPAPSSQRSPSQASASDGEGSDSLLDPEFSEQFWSLARTVVRRSAVVVDEVTTEVVRLRNANHQACRY